MRSISKKNQQTAKLMNEHRNTTITVRMVLKACEAVGVDTDELLSIAGITREMANDPDAEVPFDTMRTFWKNAYRMSKDPHLALHAAEMVEIGDYKCLDYLTIHAPTVARSMENFCRYMALINTWIGWEVDSSDEGVALRMVPNAGVIPPMTYEFVFCIYIRRIRQILDQNWNAKMIRFPFPEPEDSSIHQNFFNTDIEYDSTKGELLISHACWEKPIPGGDEQLLKVLDEHARLLLESRPLPDDFIAQVKQAIVREMHGGDALRDTIANRLGMSARTLQRRLDEVGIVFTELLDEVRTELAKNKLKGSDLSLAEIGLLLGFSEQSSFTRAFKRWTGKTPREFRLSS